MTEWTKESYEAFRAEHLLSRQEGELKRFNEKIVCSDLPVFGLRLPDLRRLAKEIAKGENGEAFLAVCGRGTYEERLLYGLVLAELPISYEAFLGYCDVYTEKIVENWSHCDSFCVSLKKRLKGQERAFFQYIEKYLQSENPWAVRVGLIVMLDHYLKPEYIKAVLERTDSIHREEYYVRMGQAWLLATAWAKEREAVLAYLPHHNLEEWVFHKFIQKCCESYRVSPEDKAYLRSLRKGKERIAFSAKNGIL